MRKIFLLLLLFAGIWQNTHAQAVEWATTQKKYAGGWQFGSKYQSIASNKNFMVVLSGFVDTITFKNQPLIASGTSDLYLAKYKADGTPLWIKQIKIDAFNSGPTDVAIDSANNIIISGQFKDSVVLDNTAFQSNNPNHTNSFIAKFNDSGILQWLKPITSTDNIQFTDLTTDKKGNICITGYFFSNVSFNSSSSLTTIGAKTFAAKYNAAGILDWAKIVGNQSPSASVSVSNSGNIYILGRSLVKYSSNGVVKWRKPLPDSLTTSTEANIKSDKNDNVYLVGRVSQTTSFGPYQVQTANPCLYISKIDSSGNWTWAKKATSTNATSKVLILDSLNNIYISGHFSYQLLIANATFNVDTRQATNAFVAKYNSLGNAIWAHQVNGATNAANDLTEDSRGNLYLLGEYRKSVCLGNTYLSSQSTFGSYIFKFKTEANTLTGNVFIDTNNNGTKEVSEISYPNAIFKTDFGETYLNASIDGNYSIFLPSGIYNFNLLQPANHYTFLPQNHSVSFTGLGQTQVKDFALAPIPNRNDVKITVTNITGARPGFKLKYRITYENVGTTTLSDSITLNYAANHLTYNSATTAPASQQTGKLRWFYQPLQPTEKRNIDVEFTVAASTPINTKLNALAVIKPLTIDFIPGNNSDTLNHVVTGSFDPNDKQVNYTSLTPTQVANGQLLDYVIRFQNTGNDTAFTVVVRDSISSKLNMVSFELLSASHSYTFRLLDNGMAEWRFDNLKLPDAAHNEPASHGFIRYRMQPKTNLVSGDEIKSKAAIYFDYNAPVNTNYAITRVSLISGLEEITINNQALKLYPNPARETVMVEADLQKSTEVTVSLVNMLGQTIRMEKLMPQRELHYQMLLNKLPKGIYIVKLETENQMLTKRLVVQ